jgi:hypothetical protein
LLALLALGRARLHAGIRAAGGCGERDAMSLIDLGHGHTMERAEHAQSCPYFGNGTPSGFIDNHLKGTTSEPCSGWICVCDWCSAGQPHWQLVSEDPLHLEPSLLCRACGDHGFVRDGKWVPA